MPVEVNGLDFRNLTSRLRIEIARERIAETELPLATIARSLGYSNQFNFSRTFRRHFGKPPSEFRLSARSVARAR